MCPALSPSDRERPTQSWEQSLIEFLLCIVSKSRTNASMLPGLDPRTILGLSSTPPRHFLIGRSSRNRYTAINCRQLPLEACSMFTQKEGPSGRFLEAAGWTSRVAAKPASKTHNVTR